MLRLLFGTPSTLILWTFVHGEPFLFEWRCSAIFNVPFFLQDGTWDGELQTGAVQASQSLLPKSSSPQPEKHDCFVPSWSGECTY